MSRSPDSQDNMYEDTNEEGSVLPERCTTLLFPESFEFIEHIQDMAADDQDLPAIDHGILASAALALMAEMPNAPQRVIDRALQLMVERRGRAGREN